MNTPSSPIVIITGGTSGIGKELALLYAKDNATVIAIGRDKARGEAFVATDPAHLHFVQADMTDADLVDKALQKVVANYGQIDVMVNNAGVFMGGEIRDTPLKNWQTTVNNNIWAVYNGTHFAYQQMLKQGYGQIVNVASAAGLFPMPAMSIYGSTKFAIVGLTQALRNEAASLNIKVSVVCPTVVDTPLYDTANFNHVKSGEALRTRKKFQTAAVAAAQMYKGIKRNKAIIHTAFSTRVGEWGYRLSPAVWGLIARRIHKVYRQKLRA